MANNNDCPNCGEPDMLFFPGEEDDEPDIYECPECGYVAG